jgi:hypothetical protein
MWVPPITWAEPINLRAQSFRLATPFGQHRLQRVQSPSAQASLFDHSVPELEQDRDRDLLPSLFRDHHWHVSRGDPPIKSGMADAEESSRAATRNRAAELRFEVFTDNRDLGSIGLQDEWWDL